MKNSLKAPFRISNVIYTSQDNNNEKIKEICKKITDFIDNNIISKNYDIGSPSLINPEKIDHKKVLSIELQCSFLIYLSCLFASAKHKDKSFEEEEEVRIYTLMPEELEFRQKNLLIPYTKFSFEKTNIKEIIISPTQDENLILNGCGLEIYIHSLGLKNIEIKKSKIPYRSN